MTSKLTLSLAIALALTAAGGSARANPMPTSTDEARAPAAETWPACIDFFVTRGPWPPRTGGPRSGGSRERCLSPPSGSIWGCLPQRPAQLAEQCAAGQELRGVRPAARPRRDDEGGHHGAVELRYVLTGADGGRAARTARRAPRLPSARARKRGPTPAPPAKRKAGRRC